MRVNGEELYSSRGVSCKLKIGRNTMMQHLRDRGILKRDNFPVLGYEDCFKVRRALQFDKATTYWTEKGIRLTEEVCKDLPKLKLKTYKQPDLDGDLIDIIN